MCGNGDLPNFQVPRLLVGRAPIILSSRLDAEDGISAGSRKKNAAKTDNNRQATKIPKYAPQHHHAKNAGLVYEQKHDALSRSSYIELIIFGKKLSAARSPS